MKGELDRVTVIKTLSEIGLIDPFSSKRKGEEAQQTLSLFDISKDIYPEKIMEPIREKYGMGHKFVNPPKVIFLPHPNIIRTMVRAILKYGTEPEFAFMMRFGIVEDMSRYMD